MMEVDRSERIARVEHVPDEQPPDEQPTTRATSTNVIELKDGERALARQLKAATLAAVDEYDIAHVERISDFEYAQHALVMLSDPTAYGNIDVTTGIVDEDTLHQAVERIARLQYFRNEYDIDESVEQGTRSIRGIIQQHPGLLLHLDRDVDADAGDDGISRRCGGVMVADGGTFDAASAIGDARHWKTFLVGRYYSMQAMFPHFVAMRLGYLLILECDGLPWEQYVPHLRFHERFHEELMQAYPCNYKGFQAYNTPSVVNIVYSVIKKFRGEHDNKKSQIGLRLDDETSSQCERLSDLFATNTTDELLANAADLLQERAVNVARFSLD